MRLCRTLKMGEVFITLKIMPTSPDVNIGELRDKAKAKAEELGAKIFDVKEEPIAFGLVAIMLTVIWPEEKDPDVVESELAKVENVNSVQVTDVRRAIA